MKDIKIKLALLIFVSIAYGCDPKNEVITGPTEPPVGNNKTEFTLSDFNKNYLFIESSSKVKDRNFYWSTIVSSSNAISTLIKNDQFLNDYLEKAKSQLEVVKNDNSLTALEIANALKFSATDAVKISLAIKDLVQESPEAFISFSNAHIGPSGAFSQFSEVVNVDRLQQLIVEEMLAGINQIIDTYAAGKDPLYPKIDSVSFDVNSPEYKQLLMNLVSDLENNKEDFDLFFEPYLNFAMGVMELNGRDEAGRYFPMQNTLNKATFENLNTIDWNDYEYSVIVVLGDSPNSPGDLPNISLGGMARADHGVELFNQGKAPIIAFCGGHLWPVHTMYSEAIEMKKYVMDKYSIPENRILVDPHSRHTTTNLRNISRQFFRYGIPSSKKAIVSTSKSHSGYVASTDFQSRSQREMNHIPIKLFNRLSDFDLEFTPNKAVLHLDSTDPLDP